jgi:hypothetical protein
MKRTITAALLLLLTTTAAAFQAAKPWEKFTSAQGRFNVLMPGTPQEKKETKQGTGPLFPLNNYLYTSQEEGAIYLVGWVDYNPSARLDVQGELAANRDNFVKSLKATLVSEKPIKIGTHPGIEFTGDNAQVSFSARVYVVGQRPYMLAALTIKGRGAPAQPEKFFSSFALTPAR